MCHVLIAVTITTLNDSYQNTDCDHGRHLFHQNIAEISVRSQNMVQHWSCVEVSFPR